MPCHLACTEESAPQALPLRVHSLPRCDVPLAIARGNLELRALGDFEASNESAEVLPLRAPGVPLRFPVATRAVEAHVGKSGQTFAGYGERRKNGLDLLLWPEQATCELWRPDGTEAYPGRRGGQALAVDTDVAFAAGGNDPLVSDAIVGALSFDISTGAVAALDTSDEGALAQPRAFATATPFGPRFLVAGGEVPVFGVPDRDLELQATAELFDAKLGRFSDETIALHSTRTHHAAVTLVDGRTLLVGGRSKIGETSIAQYQLEIVDPTSMRASVGDAIAPRIDPRALRLSDDRVFVGGGVGLDGALTQPVGEWLTPVGRRDDTRLSPEVAPRFDRAFVATAGGGVLAVGGCEDRPADSTEDAATCAAECEHGCPPLGGEYDGWWIRPDGAASPVSLDGIVAPRPILLPGSDGSPWLVAASAEEPNIPRLFRFNPWAAGFTPALVPDGLRLPRPGMPQPLAVALDAFVWFDDDDSGGALLGLRLGTRNRYVQDVALVLLSDPFETRPQHLVPDAPIGDVVSYDGRLRFSGHAAPDANVTIRLADADYADVTVKLHVSDGTPPQVLLGTTPLGGSDCPWPVGTARGGDFDLPTVARHDGRAVLRFHGESRSCPVQTGRLDLGLRSGELPGVVEQLDVARSVDSL